jgi:hypothetical protein
MSEIFVLAFVALYAGWITVAALRSNRRHGTNSVTRPPEAPTES